MRVRLQKRARTYKLFRETKTRVINITASLVMASSSLGGVLPVLLFHQASAAGGTLQVTAGNLQGWSELHYPTNAGTASFVSDPTAPQGVGALELSTPSGEVMYDRNATNLVPVTDVNFSYQTKRLSGASYAAPAYVLGISTDGSTSTDHDIYAWYEPVYNGGANYDSWQTWQVGQSAQFWSSSAVGTKGGANGANLFTLQDVAKAYPDAKVNEYTINLGSGNDGWSVLVDNVVTGDATYDFEPSPSLTAGDFATWDNSPSFRGVNVGFSAANFGTVSNVTVDVTRADGSHVIKTADAGILNLLSDKTTPTAASAPIIIQPGTYNEADGYWKPQTYTSLTTSADWTTNTLPVSATVTVTGTNGTQSVTMKPLTETAGASFVGLLPPQNIHALDNTHNNYAALPTGVVANTVNPTQVDLVWDSVPGTSHYITTAYLNGSQVGNPAWTGTPNAWVGASGAKGVGFGSFGDGTYTFKVCAYITGSSTPSCATSGDYMYDTTKPTAKFTDATTNPVPNGTYNGDIPVAYAVQDNIKLKSVNIALFDTDPTHSNHWVATCYSNGAVDNTSDSGNCTIHLPSNIPDGTYYVQIGGQDAAGYWTVNATRTVTIDRTAPTGLTNVSPSDGAFTTTAKLTDIDWTDAADAHGPVSYYYESSSSSATNGDGSFVSPAYRSGALSTSQISTLNTPAGVYYWHVRAVDSVGNSTAWTSAWKVTVDNTRPTVSFVSPTDFTKPFATGPTVAVNASDANGLSALAIHVYDSSNKLMGACGSATAAELANGSMSCDLSGLADGTYSIKAGANDKAGNNTTISSGSFTIDRTAPVITDTLDVSLLTGETSTLSPKVTESSAHTYKWTVSDSKLLNNPHDTLDGDSLKIGPAPKGSYTATLTVTDAAGNAATATYHVTISDHANVHAAALVGGFGGGNPNLQGSNKNAVRTGNTTQAANGQVLGDSTETPGGSSTASSNDGQVKGASTATPTTVQTVQNADSKKSSSLLGLGWWWLAILFVVGVGGFVWGAFRRSERD